MGLSFFRSRRRFLDDYCQAQRLRGRLASLLPYRVFRLSREEDLVGFWAFFRRPKATRTTLRWGCLTLMDIVDFKVELHRTVRQPPSNLFHFTRADRPTYDVFLSSVKSLSFLRSRRRLRNNYFQVQQLRGHLTPLLSKGCFDCPEKKT